MFNKVKGKVFTASVSQMKEIQPNCEEIWLITRAGADIPNTIRVRGLAPGPELYKDFIEKWKDSDPKEWWPKYQERFMEELKLPEKRMALRKLWRLLLEGKNIGLLCFCSDYRYCHRTIVGEVLSKEGAQVEEVVRNRPKDPADSYVQEAFNFG